MKIAIDLDGVVYEWQRTYRYMMRAYHGVDMPPIEEFWTEWNAPDQYTTRAQRDWMWDEGVKLGLFRYGHVVTGAILGLKRLHDQGHQLYVATQRPPAAVNDTMDFCRYIAQGMFDWSGIFIISDGSPKTIVPADVLVDDRPENCVEWAATGRHAVVFDRPWNQKLTSYKMNLWRAYDWEGVTAIVRYIRDQGLGQAGSV